MELADYGLEFGNPDFVRYAESYGAHGHRADCMASLERLLETALNGPGVYVIDCPIDYDDSKRFLFDELPALSAGLVD